VPPVGRLARPLSFALPRGAVARRLGIALAVLALLGGGWLLLRNSPLVAVEHVQVAGVQGVDTGPIDAALQGAARGMSTLNVNVGALRAAVAPYRVVRALSVSAEFPHGLRIHVVEQLPVAALSAGGVHTAVAADGVVLGPELLARVHVPLPAIALAAGSWAPLGGHVENATARAELSVLGAAPRVLLGWVSRVFVGPEGLTVAMRNGLSIYFGDATRPHAKWLSAARVLADPSSAGATYVDVRAPERPAAGTTAAGGLVGGDVSTGQGSATDATSAALATVLAEAISGGSGTASATGSAAGASSAAGSSATPAPSGASGATAGAASSATEPSTTAPSTGGPSATEPSAANPGAAAGVGGSEAGGASPTEPSATGTTSGG
jgi:cell division protein FtsQ